MSALLVVKKLDFSYPHLPAVLSGINLSINNGERVGLIGPNGAGKTTLFLLACGIIKPLKGEIEILGVPVRKGDFNPAIGMVFQHTSDQLINPSVREDIAFGPRNMGFSESKVEERVNHAAAATGITKLLERVPHQLSSGEQRLVALAGILAMKPKLLILDEPTSDLDMRYRRRLIGLLTGMNDKTMILASHDLEFILEVCSRVILLDQGIIQAEGLPQQVMSDRCLMERHGLEVPHSLTAAWHQHRGTDAPCP